MNAAPVFNHPNHSNGYFFLASFECDAFVISSTGVDEEA